MSYNINSQFSNNINDITAQNSTINFAAKANSRYVEAPQQLPRFSLTQSLNDKDEFRKNVIRTNYQTKERKNSFKKFLTIALIGTLTAIGYKKIIK